MPRSRRDRRSPRAGRAPRARRTRRPRPRSARRDTAAWARRRAASSAGNDQKPSGVEKISTSSVPFHPAARNASTNAAASPWPSPGSARASGPMSRVGRSARWRPVTRSSGGDDGVRPLGGEVVAVGRDPDVREAGVVEHRERVRDGADERRRVALRRGGSARTRAARLSSRAAAAARWRPSTRIARASASSRPPSGPLSTTMLSGSYCASRRIDAQIAAIRSSGSAGPSRPGIPSWRNDGTVGMQFETVSPAARSASRFAASSSGSFISQRPIASKPASA